MKNFYYLKTCDTCRRIMKELSLNEGVRIREIKGDPLSPEEIERLGKKAGSFESIFNKRARKLREKGLNVKELSEKEFQNLLNEDYSFLKRPLFELDKTVIAGNSKQAIEAMKAVDP